MPGFQAYPAKSRKRASTAVGYAGPSAWRRQFIWSRHYRYRVAIQPINATSSAVAHSTVFVAVTNHSDLGSAYPGYSAIVRRDTQPYEAAPRVAPGTDGGSRDFLISGHPASFMRTNSVTSVVSEDRQRRMPRPGFDCTHGIRLRQHQRYNPSPLSVTFSGHKVSGEFVRRLGTQTWSVHRAPPNRSVVLWRTDKHSPGGVSAVLGTVWLGTGRFSSTICQFRLGNHRQELVNWTAFSVIFMLFSRGLREIFMPQWDLWYNLHFGLQIGIS